MPRLLLTFLAFAATGLLASDRPPEYSPDRICVAGWVKKPCLITPRDGLTFTKALGEAGGFKDFAERHRIRIWKNAEQRFIVVNAYAVHRKEAADPLLQKGDVIIVDQYVMTGF